MDRGEEAQEKGGNCKGVTISDSFFSTINTFNYRLNQLLTISEPLLNIEKNIIT